MQIYQNYETAKESTFKIGGIAAKAAFPSSIEELTALLSEDTYDVVLGNCSNILFSSEQINKNIIITKNIKGFSFKNNRLYAECGARGPYIAKECEKRHLSGFEFLTGFPGSFGGMLYMNASAHNQSISDTFVCARVYDLKNKKITFLSKAEMEFGYRKSKITGGNFIVLDAEFELEYGDAEKIKEITARNIEFRTLRQPSLTCGNAGSVFKNPENDSAGRLLDLCGMKGMREGGAKVFEKHANFIINENNASSTDVLKLMHKMYSKVKEKYTIELEPEIKYIGDEKLKEYELWRIMTENMQTIQK